MTDPATTDRIAQDRRLAASIATMMRVGTIIASVLLVAGAAAANRFPGPTAPVLLAGGCGLLVALPVIRLAMMTGHFVRISDRSYVVISVTVLVLVLAGGAVGLAQ